MKVSGGVMVEDVDELLLLVGSDHGGVALGVDGQVLPRNDAVSPRLVEGLLVDLVDVGDGGVVLEDDEAAGVRANDVVVLLGTGEGELSKGANGTEDPEVSRHGW